MRKVAVIYHAEPEGFWAESPDVPGFSAAGDSLGEVVDLARDSLEMRFDNDLEYEDRLIIEGVPEPATAYGWFSSIRTTVDQVAQVATRAAGVLTTHVTFALAGPGTVHSGAPTAARG